MPDTTPRPRAAATVAPTPVAPAAGAVAPLDAVTFRWTAPPGATFDLRVAAAAAPDTPLVELAGLPTTETTLADALPAGDLVWWVRRSGGAWSAPTRFRAGTPADVEAALRTEAEDAARRRAADRAARHLPGAAEPLPEAPPEPVWPHASGEALEGAPAVDWSAVPGFEAPARAEVRTLDVPAPRPLGPLGGEVVDAVTVALRWEGVPGAVGYEAELSPHAAFDREVLTLDAGTATEVSLPGLVPAAGRRLLWRVRARTPTGATPWSPYGRFYPAGEAAVEAFREGLAAARLAARRRRDHERRVEERELALVPEHERPGAHADTGALVGILALLATGMVGALLVLAASLVRF